MAKIVRLIDEQWQGGMNPDYRIGAQIMAAIIPPTLAKDTKTITTPVTDEAIPLANIDAGKTLLQKMTAVYQTLLAEAPAKVVTIGGDCAVSQAPFDYLHYKYPDDLGMIWLDAHPDISNNTNSHHVHEMVVANLLQKGAPDFNELVKNPFKPEQVLLAGLQYQDLRPMDQQVNELNISYVAPKQLVTDSEPIITWLVQNNFKHVVVHWDMDVLTPADFHSILPAEPGLDIKDFGAAVGELKLEQVLRILSDISQTSELVGLTIAEHMPWDAIRLRNGLSKLSIFK